MINCSVLINLQDIVLPCLRPGLCLICTSTVPPHSAVCPAGLQLQPHMGNPGKAGLLLQIGGVLMTNFSAEGKVSDWEYSVGSSVQRKLALP